MKKKKIASKDLLLCFLYSPGQGDEENEPITGRTKLTKMMFLFEKEIYSQFFEDEIEIELPNFEPYYFGPFSKQLFEDLAFFLSIGMIQTVNTSIPISPADKVEGEEVFDISIDDEWGEEFFESDEKYESEYSLSSSGLRYVEEKIWNLLSIRQKETLHVFKKQINRISLDALLNYVYNKYPEQTTQSKIAQKYLPKKEE